MEEFKNNFLDSLKVRTFVVALFGILLTLLLKLPLGAFILFFVSGWGFVEVGVSHWKAKEYKRRGIIDLFSEEARVKKENF